MNRVEVLAAAIVAAFAAGNYENGVLSVDFEGHKVGLDSGSGVGYDLLIDGEGTGARYGEGDEDEDEEIVVDEYTAKSWAEDILDYIPA